MIADREFLRRYLEEGSQAAFTELVQRHLGLVYGTALRQLHGETALAEEVAQTVFAALAAQGTKALQIAHLAGWLYATTRHTAAHTVRTERRRQERERKALAMPSPEPDETAPLPPGALDAALERLDSRDREAVLRRYVEGESFAAIGEALALNEDAARMRVSRALGKLRREFARAGIASSAAATAAALAQQAVAAPPALVASISATAVAGAPAETAAPVVFMSTGKILLGATAVAVALGLGYAGHFGSDAAMPAAESTTAISRPTTSRQMPAPQPERAPAKVQVAAVPVPAAAPASGPEEEADSRRRTAEKLMRLKPQLAAGLPIKGAVIVTSDGRVVSHPVELVVGRQTRIPLADEGTYLITPTLNDEGSLTCRIAVERHAAPGSPPQIVDMVPMTFLPWSSFTLMCEGKIVAFDSDLPEP